MTIPPGADALEQTVDKQTLRDGMAHVASAVNIVTTRGADGPYGSTASAVCSVADTPPTVLVCVNRATQSYSVIVRSGVLCINTIGPDDKALAMSFAGGTKDMAARFAGGAWGSAVTGSPVLDSAAVAFDCRRAGLHSLGTHDVLFATVVSLRRRDEASGLVCWRRSFHSLADGKDER